MQLVPDSMLTIYKNIKINFDMNINMDSRATHKLMNYTHFFISITLISISKLRFSKK